MDYSRAIAVLKGLLEKGSLSAEQKEAVETAIGVLSLGAMAMNKVKEKKTKREKSLEW